MNKRKQQGSEKPKRMYVFAIPAIILAFAVTGCNPEAGDGTNIVTLNFADAETRSGESRPVAPSADGVYTEYGNLVAKITPDTFVLPLVRAMLFTDEPGYEDQAFVIKDLMYDQEPDETFYADFTSEEGIQYEPEVVPGVFNYFFMYLHMQDNQMTYGSEDQFTWDFETDISFDLPAEYSGVSIGTYEYTMDGSSVLFTNGSGLQAGVFPDMPLSYFYIFGETDAPGLYNEEGNEIDLGEEFNQDYGLGTAGAPVIRGPFDPITVPESFENLTVNINFDITDIIHLYDNGSSGDLTDDILVFAPAYWDRISVDYTLAE